MVQEQVVQSHEAVTSEFNESSTQGEYASLQQDQTTPDMPPVEQLPTQTPSDEKKDLFQADLVNERPSDFDVEDE